MEDKKDDQQSEELVVCGRRWDSTKAVVLDDVHEGMSLEAIIVTSARRLYSQYEYTDKEYNDLLKYARCKLNGVEIPRSQWANVYPKKGSFIEVFHGVRGGNGSVMGIIQVVIGAVMAVVGYAFGWTGVGAIIGNMGVGLMITGTMTLLSDVLFPAAKPNLGISGNNNAEDTSTAYSITGARNQANVDGYVPLICGTQRFTPPLGGRSWTMWEGDDQFFHMLVVWGHKDVQVSDFRIDDTPLSSFDDVTHVFHQSSRGNDLRYFSRSYNEMAVGAVLAYGDDWTVRTIDDTEAISLDFAFEKGFTSIHPQTGERRMHDCSIAIQYRGVSSNPPSPWYDLDDGTLIQYWGVEHQPGTNVWKFFGNSTSMVTRNVRMDGFGRGTYEIRCKRISPEPSGVDVPYLFDEIKWTTYREIINQPAFNTPIPICVSELRIRASEQLQGYVETFNALVQSRIPDWNGSSWVTRNTRNPASIMRYMLTSTSCLAKPYSTSRLDNDSFVTFWNYCNTKGYTFDYICDTEMALWERLVQVAAVGRGAPTADIDGKWGVVIDSAGKTPVQMFTPRNSWGLQVQRQFVKMPDALRVSFVDASDNYTQKQGFVYNDGYSASNAQEVVEWSFPGITNWTKIYQQGRMYLARMLHRQFTITLSTDWEWIRCHRGDLVGVSSDIVMNTFGTARINGLVYGTGSNRQVYNQTDTLPGGVPTGVRIDNTILYSELSPARYGIAVRFNNGTLVTYELQPEYNEERNILMFKYSISSAQIPPIGALVSVSLLGEEYEEYLVAMITPQENMAAQLTLVPYKMTEIEAAINGPIPDYDESVVLDIVRGRKLPAPIIIKLIADKTTLDFHADVYSPRIFVYWRYPASNADPRTFSFQARAQDVNTGEIFFGVAPGSQPYVPISGVFQDHTYSVKIRATDPTTGLVSLWSAAQQVTVTGPVAPETPRNITIVADPARGLVISWDALRDYELDHYEVYGPNNWFVSTTETSVVYEPWGQTGVLTFSVYSVNIWRLKSLPGVVSFTVLAPAAPTITSAILMDPGIVMEWTDARTTWPISVYTMMCNDAVGTSVTTNGICPVPEGFARGDMVYVKATDIFRNTGEWSEQYMVTIILPLTPTVNLEVDDKGNVLVTWNDCKTVTTITKYILEGAVHGFVSGLSTELSVKDILWTTVEELGVTYRIGAVTVYVTAEDKYGFQGGRGGQTFVIYPPYNPVLALRVQSDGLYLVWQDCKRSFLIDHYVVYDEYYNETYITDTTTQLLKPRPAGYYNFYVTAVDVVGSESARMSLTNYLIDGVGVVHASAVIDGSDVLLTWGIPGTTFPMDYYTIYDQHGTILGKAKTTYFRFPAPVAGAYEYSVVGTDVAGNTGTEGVRAAITINPPVAPTVYASLAGEDGVTLHWVAGFGTNTLPVVAWDVVRQWDITREDQIVETQEEDYGRLDVDTLTVPAFVVSTHTIMVRAIDSAGNVGPWGYTDFVVSPPGQVLFVNCATIDNNVMLYWTPPTSIFFPIAYYLFEQIDEDDYSMEIGRIDALFTSTFESVSGTYTYAVTPVDIAGNRGTQSRITMHVAQPPDFLMYHDVDSLFNGTKVHMTLDGVGGLIGPVSDTTWQENLDTIASLQSVTASDITWQQKIDYGYEYYLDPDAGASTGTYVEVVDAGTIVPSTKITVSITERTLSGTPVITCKIEVSTDGTTWRTVADDATIAYATNFRYCRYTISVTGGVVDITNLNFKLGVKRLTDFGSVTSNASDNGAGYVDDQTTPMLKGTWVPFKVSFVDVESLPKPNVVNNSNYTAYTVFEDVVNPTGFRVFVLDKNGNRVTADVDWVAYGV